LKSITKIWPAVIILLAGLIPLYAVVEVVHVNTTTVPLYEKFEAVINLGDASYDNPYDPEEIDLQAVFTAPSGKEWHIFGFYDDHLNRDEWKIRFSPNEAGTWHYTLTAKNADTTEQSVDYQFTAEASEHHGWIRVSSENPHYMTHDDGMVYYGVGMYTPWRNTIETFDILEEYGANLFGIWNIMYGGLVNGTGIIEEELGCYNQLKCGRIDTLLLISEERNLKCMLAIWPHDLFSATVWAHQWDQNPYNAICDVEDVYSDSLCWAYQKKQYRYLIARFAHSRAFGIWEIINEINGTDGWAAGRTDEALNWVQKVNAFFEEHDPYRHPTTASRSGGYSEYWPEMYPHIDLPNLHLYETQGWPQHYIGNPLRSSLANYAYAALRFWDTFNQPGILGEAGYDWVTFNIHSPEYTAHFHNAIWACLTNGLAATPVWWTYNDPIGVSEWQHMAHFSTFIRDIDFIAQSREHFEHSTSDFDIYGMKNDSSAFGWIRHIQGQDISGKQFSLEQVLNPEISVYAVSYYHTWTGEYLAVHNRPHVNGILRDVMPDLGTSAPDIAFKLSPTICGETPTQIELSTDVYQVLNIDTLSLQIACFLFDDHERFCSQADNVITFTAEGPGILSGLTQISAQNGAAFINLQLTEETGLIQITAASPGLLPDTILILVKDRFVLDDFETYESDMALQNIWTTKSETTADVYLETINKEEGNNGMRLVYAIGPEHKTIARIEKEVNQGFKDGNFFSFWMLPDGSNREMEIRIRDKNAKYWTYYFNLTSTTPVIMAIPIDHFASSTATLPMDLSMVSTLTLTIKKGDGIDGSGTIYFDSFKFPDTAPSGTKNVNYNTVPGQFELVQNYPNPFNATTTIAYRLPKRSHLRISIYNILGQKIETVMNGIRNAGDHKVIWDTSNLASGIYFYKMEADHFTAIKKCGLVK
jgi:hypothetical protein